MTDNIQNRKQAHLNLCLDDRVRGTGASLNDVHLPFDALFEVSPKNLDMRSMIAGIPVDFPLMIGAMTGGIPAAAPFNTMLRKIAHKYNIAMELGSVRILLENPDLIDTYGEGPVQALFANIGASEICSKNVDSLALICEKLGASGLCIHLNGLQEWAQDDGNHDFSCSLDSLSAFICRFPLPVLIKEVGSGIGGTAAEKLGHLPIAGLETASLGGTSWVKIEAIRRRTALSEQNIEALSKLGYDIKTSIRDCRKALGPKRTLIASGGIETPDELIKCLFLGADMAAMAQPLYWAWHKNGNSGLENFIAEFIDVSKIIWRSTGCCNIQKLQNCFAASENSSV